MSKEKNIQFGQAALALGFIDSKLFATYMQQTKDWSGPGEFTPFPQWLLKNRYVDQSQLSKICNHVARSTQRRMSSSTHVSSRTDIVQTKKKYQQLGRYRIVEELGRGGMGLVYKAYDTQLERMIALKTLTDHSERNIERFKREPQASSKLDHPNIIKFYEISSEQETHFFTMDFIEGDSLELLMRKSSLSVRQIVEIMSKVGNAIHYAHSHGVVHRDIKPANIMIGSDKQPIVMDFGLAKLNHSEKNLSQSGDIIGTVYYMSPEQAEAKKNIDARSDIYSIGAVMYEMLTGQRPFVGKSFFDIVDKILHHKPKSLREIKQRIPEQLENICLKALAKSPDNRYQTVQGLVSDLKRFSQGERVLASSQKRKTSSKSSKYAMPVIASIVCLLVLAIFLPSSKKTPQKKIVNTTKIGLKLKASTSDVDGKATAKFPVDEHIRVEVIWESRFKGEEVIEFFGNGIVYVKEKLNKVNQGKRHHNFLVKTNNKSGKFQATVKISSGKLSDEVQLKFEIVPKKTKQTVIYLSTKFFNSGERAIPWGMRRYEKNFALHSTYYVYTEVKVINLFFMKKKNPVDLHLKYYRVPNTFLAESKFAYEILPSKQEFYLWNRADINKWEIGDYKVEVFLQEEKVAEDTFSIYQTHKKIPTIVNNRFFEGPNEFTVQNVGVIFPIKKTRYIFTELKVKNTLWKKRPNPLAVVLRYYAPNGIFVDCPKAHTIAANLEFGKIVLGAGYATPGKWFPGKYQVELWLNGVPYKLKKSAFTIR